MSVSLLTETVRPNEDFGKISQDLQGDLEILEEEGVDAVLPPKPQRFIHRISTVASRCSVLRKNWKVIAARGISGE